MKGHISARDVGAENTGLEAVQRKNDGLLQEVWVVFC